jgi:hypothetical protein
MEELSCKGNYKEVICLSDNQNLGYDVDGEEVITNALWELLSEFSIDKTIGFSNLDKDSGFSFYPISGAAIDSEKEDICGNVTQVCQYPFVIVYRNSPKLDKHKIRIKELLDTIGKWLEGQSVTVNGAAKLVLSAYPKLSGGRRIISIRRVTPAFVDETSENGTQDWIIQMNLKYKNTFERKF